FRRHQHADHGRCSAGHHAPDGNPFADATLRRLPQERPPPRPILNEERTEYWSAGVLVLECCILPSFHPAIVPSLHHSITPPPRSFFVIILKSHRDLESMRPACAVASSVLDEVSAFIQPGGTTQQVNEFAAARMKHYSAKGAFLG